MNRHLYKSEKKLANRGWQDMRRMLDQELPGERRRRPVVLIWILSLMVPAGGALGWWLFGPEGRGNAVPGSTVPIAGVQDVRPATQATRAVPSPNDAPLTSTAAPDDSTRWPLLFPVRKSPADRRIQRLVQEKNAISAIANPAPAGNSVLSENGEPGVAAALQQQVTAAIEPANTTTPTVAPALQTGTEQTEAIAETNLAASQPAAETAGIEPGAATAVPVAAPPGENSPVTTAEPQTAIPVTANSVVAIDSALLNPALAMPLIDLIAKTEPQQRWGLGAAAGVLSENATGYGGAVAGLTAEWKPLPQWGLRSGLAYQYQALPDESGPVVSLNAMTYTAVKTPPTSGRPLPPARRSSSPSPVYTASKYRYWPSGSPYRGSGCWAAYRSDAWYTPNQAPTA